MKRSKHSLLSSQTTLPSSSATFPVAVLLMLGTALLVAPLTLPVQAQNPSSPQRAIIRTPAERQSIASARDRALGLIQNGTGPVAAPVAPPQDWEGWLYNRYRGAGADREMIGGLVHQDLELAALWLDSPDGALRRRGVRAAAIANLYASSLEAAGEPRLRASIYDGFLLPFVADAPTAGLGNASSILEGAAVAFRRMGQVERQIRVLSAIVAQGPQTALGDISRVHLADAFAGQKNYRAAIAQLRALTTPDLNGALVRIPELERLLAQQTLAPVPAPAPVPDPNAGGAAPNSPRGKRPAPGLSQRPGITDGGVVPPGADIGGGVAGGGVAGGGVAGGGVAGGGVAGGGVAGGGALAPGIAGVGAAGTDVAGAGLPGAGGGLGLGIGDQAPLGEATEDGTGEAPVEAQDRATRMKRALKAVQVAAVLAKKADQAATLSLAKMLDAAEADAALEAASGTSTGAAARPRRASPNAAAANPLNLAVLRTRRYEAAREASAAAEAARKTAQEAQIATVEAARLSLLLHAALPQAATTPAPLSIDPLPVAKDAATPEVPTPAAPTRETGR